MPTIETTITGALATITLCRPELRNAFNEVVIAELTRAFETLAADPQVRVVVLAAQGKAFCAGADLNWMRRMADYSHSENLADAGALARMLQAIDCCPKPTIALIQGDVYAGGLGLVAACDLAVCVQDAHFCLSEVKLGLVPATISPYVIRAMGWRAAQRYVLTAERFDALTAQRLGLVHEVVAPEALSSAAQHWVDVLCAASPDALTRSKRLLKEVAHQAIDARLIAHTVQAIADVRASAQGKEGVQAFLNKRAPAWQAPAQGNGV